MRHQSLCCVLSYLFSCPRLHKAVPIINVLSIVLQCYTSLRDSRLFRRVDLPVSTVPKKLLLSSQTFRPRIRCAILSGYSEITFRITFGKFINVLLRGWCQHILGVCECCLSVKHLNTCVRGTAVCRLGCDMIILFKYPNLYIRIILSSVCEANNIF